MIVKPTRYDPKCVVSMTPHGEIDKLKEYMEVNNLGKYVRYTDYEELYGKYNDIREELKFWCHLTIVAVIAAVLSMFAVASLLL